MSAWSGCSTRVKESNSNSEWKKNQAINAVKLGFSSLPNLSLKNNSSSAQQSSSGFHSLSSEVYVNPFASISTSSKPSELSHWNLCTCHDDQRNSFVNKGNEDGSQSRGSSRYSSPNGSVDWSNIVEGVFLEEIKHISDAFKDKKTHLI